MVSNFGTMAYDQARFHSRESVWQCFDCKKDEIFLYLRALCFAAKKCFEDLKEIMDHAEPEPQEM